MVNLPLTLRSLWDQSLPFATFKSTAVSLDVKHGTMVQNPMHASSVKTSMHRIRLPSFLRSIFAEKVRVHRVLISTNSSFWFNSKM